MTRELTHALIVTQEQKAALPPKRLPTPFVRFHTSRIREANANASEESKMDIRDIARESGRLWKEMTLTEKAVCSVSFFPPYHCPSRRFTPLFPSQRCCTRIVPD